MIKRLAIGGLIIFALGLCVHFILPRVIRLEFNKVLWDNYPKYRYSMSHSLAERIRKNKMDREEVTSLIGKPEYGGYQSNHLTYFLRSNGIIGLDSDWMDIDFSNGSTKVHVYNVD